MMCVADENNPGSWPRRRLLSGHCSAIIWLLRRPRKGIFPPEAYRGIFDKRIFDIRWNKLFLLSWSNFSREVGILLYHWASTVNQWRWLDMHSSHDFRNWHTVCPYADQTHTCQGRCCWRYPWRPNRVGALPIFMSTHSRSNHGRKRGDRPGLLASGGLHLADWHVRLGVHILWPGN